MGKVIESEAVKNVRRAEGKLKAAQKTFVLANRSGDVSATAAAAEARSAAHVVFNEAERANMWGGDGIGAFTRQEYFGGTVTARD